MLEFFREHPGRLFLVATLLPLVPAAALTLAGTVRNLTRKSGNSLYWFLGGDQPLKAGGVGAFVTMLAVAALAITGLTQFLADARELGPDSPPFAAKWSESWDWVRIGATRGETPAEAITFGYRIDHLTAILFTMVTVVGSLIVLFSIGYMREELQKVVNDHEVDRQTHGHGTPGTGEEHFHRRGRFGRFFLFLSLFAFSMLHLLIADNLLQIFVSWELVGLCSFFLIGFYYERPSASTAANKAFIMNRIGDAGFLMGIAVAWTTFGTLNIQELIALIGTKPTGDLLTFMGLGIFLGCVGKSAQFPLHTWLPDAMEGPTPVSALIHAATMVAAGVYLVGRCFPMFTPDVLLVIAYIGAITLFLAATIATVQTDIKRVLAYSTVSQLGYMMLALGVGGWTAGLFHLLTHAFFKALLFLGAGSVIVGCHHEQDLRQMGGLKKSMPITAFTMLVGVLAIAGMPFFSGWYSKDMVLAASLGFSIAKPEHGLLFALPLLTVGLTAYYMFRLWFLTFSGEPREPKVHAHESPWVMTAPLVILAVFSLSIGWGWPVWEAEASYVGHLLHETEPVVRSSAWIEAKHHAEDNHLIAGAVALAVAALGAWFAYSAFARRRLSVNELSPAASGLGKFLYSKWYFDELYDTIFRRPMVQLARLTANTDKRREDVPGFDLGTLDGWLNAIGLAAQRIGYSLKVVQTGRIRAYVLVLALTLVGLLGMLVGLTF